MVTADSPQPKRWVLKASEKSLPIHPAQIYSTIDGLLICLFLLAYEPFKRRDGDFEPEERISRSCLSRHRCREGPWQRGRLRHG